MVFFYFRLQYDKRGMLSGLEDRIFQFPLARSYLSLLTSRKAYTVLQSNKKTFAVFADLHHVKIKNVGKSNE
jgi:hypothetical protein